ncbi:emp24/gp25L/p24 family/GOLD domain-containing protein [Phthorimaea operculella]|nr:emp24/gp25L/p24 family/GOLD domain-containing protein [Phthorimaea operculella]
MHIPNFFALFAFFALLWSQIFAQEVYESDMNFRIEPGAKTCFFETGTAGQIMEAKYQVLDGQHGDYDITFQITDPNGELIVNDYKQSHNSYILDLEVTGDYVICMDNAHSVMNSKLVFVYVMIEDKHVEGEEAVETTTGQNEEQEVLEWEGIDENNATYYLPVAFIADSVTRTLRHVVKARHALNQYGALKTRDSYLAFEDTFIVDVWSSFQISCMCVVGMVQVYMIKKLFNRPAKPDYSYHL